MRSKAAFLVWLAVGLFVPLTSSAQTPQAQTEQPLVNPVTRTIQGVVIGSSVLQGNLQITIPESCRFALALPPGQKAIEARRISTINLNADDNTCDALFEVGEPAAASSASPAELENLANTSSVSSAAASTRTDDLTAADANEDLGQPASKKIQSAGFLKTWWIDPIHITLNSVRNSTTWHWRGTGYCVTGASGGQHLTWFTLSGWEKLSDSFKNTVDCTQSTSASTVLYDNPVFCAGVDTYAFYNPNMVNGLQDGTLLGTWDDSFYGSLCVYLASFRMRLERTQN